MEGRLLKEILYISYPWRRLLRELLQTKPSDDVILFLKWDPSSSEIVVSLEKPSKKTPPNRRETREFLFSKTKSIEFLRQKVEFTLITHTSTHFAHILRIESIE